MIIDELDTTVTYAHHARKAENLEGAIIDFTGDGMIIGLATPGKVFAENYDKEREAFDVWYIRDDEAYSRFYDVPVELREVHIYEYAGLRPCATTRDRFSAAHPD